MSALREYRSRATIDVHAGPRIFSEDAIWGANNNDAKRTEMRVYVGVGSRLALSSSPVVLR
jgi:hypothetical protein